MSNFTGQTDPPHDLADGIYIRWERINVYVHKGFTRPVQCLFFGLETSFYMHVHS